MTASKPSFRPQTYGAQVGSLWVAIDFEAQAVAITRTDDMNRPVKTEDLGQGFLVDRNAEGRVCAVECIG